jgi:glycosyltransferase involved in cell wall biosynthesis
VRALDEEVARCDVVHIHAMWEEMQHQACRAAQRAAKPYVLTPHGMLDPWNMTKSRLAKQAYLMLRMRPNLQRVSLLHYTTEIERRSVARLKLRPPTIVEPLGLDMREFEHLPPRGMFRRHHPHIGNRPIILVLGRVHYGKGVELLLPAAAAMKRHDAVIVIAGPWTSAGEAFEAKLRPMLEPIRDRVILTGLIGGGDKLAALVDADLLALPSFHENFGLAVIEALACGTPVVVSDQVNLHPDISAAGVGGVVPLDAAALANELDRWLDDNELRRAASARAPAFVRERYDWDAIARRWVEHYRTVAAAPAAPASGSAA